VWPEWPIWKAPASCSSTCCRRPAACSIPCWWQTNKQTDKQKDRQTDRDRQTHKQTDRQGHTNTQTDRDRRTQTDRQQTLTDRHGQTDTRTDRHTQTDRHTHTDRQTDRQRQTHRDGQTNRQKEMKLLSCKAPCFSAKGLRTLIKILMLYQWINPFALNKVAMYLLFYIVQSFLRTWAASGQHCRPESRLHCCWSASATLRNDCCKQPRGPTSFSHSHSKHSVNHQHTAQWLYSTVEFNAPLATL